MKSVFIGLRIILDLGEVESLNNSKMSFVTFLVLNVANNQIELLCYLILSCGYLICKFIIFEQ